MREIQERPEAALMGAVVNEGQRMAVPHHG